MEPSLSANNPVKNRQKPANQMFAGFCLGANCPDYAPNHNKNVRISVSHF